MRQEVDQLDRSEAMDRQIAQAEAEIAEGKRTVQMAKEEAVRIEKLVEAKNAKLENQIRSWKRDPTYRTAVMQ